VIAGLALPLLLLAQNAPPRDIAAPPAPTPVTLAPGMSSFAFLDGPWKFHVGDDPGWASPSYDDSSWASIDLRPAPGAHDPDVGLSHWVPGWAAHGYPRYAGYAWYRLHIALTAAPAEQLAMLGPALVDSAYQVFFDGSLVGGTGDFGGPVPRAYGIRPKVFVVSSPFARPSTGKPEPILVALRVYMGPWGIADPQAGGIHIAPVLGNVEAIRAEYFLQWLEKIRGDFFEIGQAMLFVFLALMAWSLVPFDRSNRAYLWMAAALVLTACVRGNLMIYWLEGGETVHAFEAISIVLLVPLTLMAWTFAWHDWFGLARNGWFTPAVVALSAVYVLAEFLTRSWFYGAFPSWVIALMHHTITWDRLVFVALWVFVVYGAVRRVGRATRVSLPAMLLIAIGQFPAELASLNVPGIWFPYGTGVSLTNFAYCFATFALFGMLLQRLWSFAPRSRDRAALFA
jgi:hypothetical protein